MLPSAYTGTGTSLNGVTTNAGDYIWIGSLSDFTLFSRSQANGALSGAFSGAIRLFQWNGNLASGSWGPTDSSYDTTVTPPNGSSDCAKIIIKKVTVGDPGTTGFTADITNNDGGGDAVKSFANVGFSVASPATKTFDPGNQGDDVTVKEDSKSGWTISGWKVMSGDVACNSDTTGFTTSSATASGGALNDLDRGETATVCFKNTNNTPSGFLTISQGACTDAVANSWTFHVIAPNTTPTQGGTLTIKYHFNGEGVDAHTVSQAENDSTPGNTRWRVAVDLTGHTSITVDHMTTGAPSNLVWNGTNGIAEATPDVSKCLSTPPSVNTVKTHTPAGNVAAGSTFHWLLTTTVTNGPTNQPTHITDNIPTGMTVNSITPSGTGAGTLGCDAGPAIDCTLSTGAGNGVYTITVSVTAPAANDTNNCHAYTNTATADYGTAIPQTKPTDTVTPTGCTNPSVSTVKSHSPAGDVAAGSSFHWILTTTVSSGPRPRPRASLTPSPLA